MKVINPIFTLVTAFCLLITPHPADRIQPANIPAQNTFYISPDGNDFAGDGSLTTPWNSLQKARDHIRQNQLNVNMTGDILVYVRAGKYYVGNTIEFSELDSGSNGFNVVYRNYDAVGAAEFIGGERVSGWSQYSGNIYRASVGKGWNFFTLYENGERARVTRYPDYAPGSNFANSQAPYLTSEGAEGSRTVLQYRPGEFDSVRWNFDNAQVYIWSGGEHDWFTDTIPIAGINRANHQIILSQETRYPINLNNKGSRYYIQGVSFWRLPRKPAVDAAQLSAQPTAETAEADQTGRTLRQTRAFIPLLSAPGEFYLDTQNGDLYYWAKGGAIADQTITAPRVKRILSVVGASENNRAHHIQFEGLTFECTDFTDWYRFGWVRAGDSGEGHRYPEFDRQIELPANRTGMLYLENTDHIVCRFNRLRDSGYSAIYMLFYNQYDTIYGNLFEHLGYNAVTLQGRYPGEGDVAKYNVISNNYIHHVGELVGHASGIEITNSGYNEVSYSTIHDSPRYAVQWRVRPNIPKEDVYLHDNLFKYLKIYNCGQDSGDTAPVYGYGISNESPYLTNTVEQVTVDNTYAHPSMKDTAPNGVFMDNCSYGQIFKNVRVTSAQGAMFRNNESGSHKFTNVNWAPGFNESLMEYANIGIKGDFPYPVTPTAVIARNTGGGIELSWEKVNNAVAYNVKRATNINGPYDTLVCTEVMTSGCTDRTADRGVHYYVVTAVLASGLESGYSNAALPFLESAGPQTKVENLSNLFAVATFSFLPRGLTSGIGRSFGEKLRR